MNRKTVAGHRRRTIMIGLALATATAALPFSAVAQDKSWPLKPIRFIVPFASGTSDVLARVLGAEITKALGQPVVVENKIGAGGAIGSAEVARSQADGYTLLMATASTHAVAPHVSKLPYDSVKDFTPIALLGSTPQLILLSPQLGVKTVKELVDYGRANPGKINYASNGIGTIGHLTFEMLAAKAGIVMNHIPYKGSGLAIPDVAQGIIQLSPDVPATGKGHVESGRVLALAVTGPKRSALVPDVPTVAETIPGFSAVTWYGLYGPAGMDPALVLKIHDAFAAAMEKPEVHERYTQLGLDLADGSSADFAAMVAKDSEGWATIVKESKIKFE